MTGSELWKKIKKFKSDKDPRFKKSTKVIIVDEVWETIPNNGGGEIRLKRKYPKKSEDEPDNNYDYSYNMFPYEENKELMEKYPELLKEVLEKHYV